MPWRAGFGISNASAASHAAIVSVPGFPIPRLPFLLPFLWDPFFFLTDPAGGVLLPARYGRVEARHGGASGLNGGPRLNKWEEFDFAAHNSTGRFAGLENDLPNAYCNALFQVRACGCARTPGGGCGCEWEGGVTWGVAV